MALELGVPRWVDEASFRPGSYDLDASAVLAFPLLEGEQVVGAAFVGDLTFSFPFARKSEAYARGVDAPGASEESSVVVWYSTELGWLDDFPAVDDALGALGWQDVDGWHVVVHAWGLAESRRRASGAAAGAARWFADLGIDPAVMRARDDARGGTRRALLAVETGRSPSGRDLLGWAFDPTGAIDTWRQEVVFDADRTVITGVARPPGERVEVVSGVANAVISDGGASHDVAIEAQIRLSAQVATRVVPLCLPATPEPVLVGLRTTPLIRRDVALSARSSPLVDLGPAWGWLGPDCADARDWLLPAPLGPASAVSVSATWREHWASSHPLDAKAWYAWALRQFSNTCQGPLECGAEAAKLPLEVIELGHASVDHALLPVQPFQPGAFPAELRVGTGLPDSWQAVIGGIYPEKRSIGGARWWIAVGARSDARVGFGRWTLAGDEPLLGFPGVQVASLGTGLGVDAMEVRAVLNFYQDALPDWPLPEFAVVEAPSLPTAALRGQHLAPSGRASPGLWSIEPLSVISLAGTGFGDSGASLELSLAEAVVSGWWDALAWAREDRWLRDALVGFYVARFAAARGLEVPMDPRVAAFDRGLAVRMGRAELLRALERFLVGAGPPTVDRLGAELVAAGGGAAGDFFDAWIVGRLAVSVNGRWSSEKGRTTVTLTAEPPIGRYEIPVEVQRGRGPGRTLWVPMADGAGSVTFDGGAEALAIDPGHVLPITGRALTAL